MDGESEFDRTRTSVTFNDIKPPTGADNLRTAYDAAERGWRVFPQEVKDGRKIPKIKDWPHEATTDPYVLQGWWANGLGHCVPGIATGYASGCWVLDPDTHKGQEGMANLRKLCIDHGEDFEALAARTFRVRTPSGGEHWYFAYPPDGEIGTGSGQVGSGIDHRGRGGQVVAPGSRVWVDGWKTYEVINPTSELHRAPAFLEELARPTTHEARPLDAALVGRLAGDAGVRQYALNALDREAQALERQTEGGRNSVLNKAAYSLGGLAAWGALSEAEVWDRLVSAGKVSGLFGDDGPEQFRATFESGWSKGIAEPRALPPWITEGKEPDRPLRFRSLGEVRRTRRPIRFLVPNCLLSDAYGVVGGAEKTLKSYQLLDLAVGVASGHHVWGNEIFTPAERRRVLIITGEGGADLALDRIDHLAQQHALNEDDLDDWIWVTEDISATSSAGFREGVTAAMKEFGPGLVIIDPAYVYLAPEAGESGNVFKMGRLLTEARQVFIDAAEAARLDRPAVIWGHHFTKTGKDELSLSSLTQAGFREAVDHWWLVRHRAAPDLVNQRFQLRVLMGARRGFGWESDVDITLGPFDPETMQHAGVPVWSFSDGVTAPVPRDPDRLTVSDAYDLMWTRIRSEPFQLTQAELIGEGEGSSARGKAFKRLKDKKMIQKGPEKVQRPRANGRLYPVDVWGPVMIPGDGGGVS